MKFIRLAGFDSENTESAVWDLKSLLFTGEHGRRKVWKSQGSSCNMRPFKGENSASIHAIIYGRWEISRPYHCVLEMGFYEDISWESRCNIEINVGPRFYEIFFGFWSTLSSPSQRDSWKKLKLPKVGKGCLKLSFFLWFTLVSSHIDGIISVKQIGLGLAKKIKKY